MGKGRGVCRVFMGKPEGKIPLRRPGVDGRIILKWISRKWDMGVWTGSSWLMIGCSWWTIANAVMYLRVP
jgi:hypothetical protein